jgi:hypothetical protein
MSISVTIIVHHVSSLTPLTIGCTTDDKQSPTSVLQSNEMTELDKLDDKRNDEGGFFSDHDASDDDLL